MRIFSLLAVLAILPFSVMSAAVSIDFQDTIAIPAAGIRLPLMRRASAVPLKPPSVFMYALRQGADEWTEDRYDIRELWYATQYIAAWKDKNGNCLTIGRITSILSAGLDNGHVTADKYREIINSPAASVNAIDSELLKKWVHDFTLLDIDASTRLDINRGRLSEVWRFSSADPHTMIYAVRFDPSRTGNDTASERMIVLVAVTTGPDLIKDRKIVESLLIGKLAALGRFEGRREPIGIIGQDGRNVREHPSRTAARQSIASQEDWWYLDSEDYIVLSNNKAAKRFADDLLEDMQLARSHYLQLLPPDDESLDDVSVIRIFATDDEYSAYVGDAHRWTSGIFDPMRRELVIRPPSEAGRGSAYKKTLSVALHEGFHQYDFFASGGKQSSAWYNEGFASFFEVMKIDRGEVSIGENKMRVQPLETMVKSGVPCVMPLLQMDYESFYSGSNAERQAKYSAAWAIAYYLERGAPQERNDPYAEILTRYREALLKTGNAEQATAIAFANIDLDRFQRDFNDFWKTPRRRQNALRGH